MTLLHRQVDRVLVVGTLLSTMGGVTIAGAFMVVPLSCTALWTLEIPAKSVTALVEQLSLLVTGAVGGS